MKKTSQLTRIAPVSFPRRRESKSYNIFWIPAEVYALQGARMTRREELSTINQKPSTAQSAFTLVEMAIVLVIIGTLVAGVLKGQELIQQSKNRTILSDMESYKAAAFMFKDKFGQYPGDTTRAFAIWGSACDAVQTNCDGDGDGRILSTSGSTSDMEQTRFWQHLSLAKLVKGTYVGVGQPGHINANTSPRGPIEFSGYIVDNGESSDSGWITANSLRNKNYLRFGNCGNTSRGCYHNPIIDPATVLSIDTKIDDGKPDLGLVTVLSSAYVSFNVVLQNCKTGAEPNSIYNINYSGAACVIQYAID